MSDHSPETRTAADTSHNHNHAPATHDHPVASPGTRTAGTGIPTVHTTTATRPAGAGRSRRSSRRTPTTRPTARRRTGVQRRGHPVVKISLLLLGITAIGQVVIVILSGSIALAADTIHNFSDA